MFRTVKGGFEEPFIPYPRAAAMFRKEPFVHGKEYIFSKPNGLFHFASSRSAFL